jgi:ABC-type transport system involved in cytochrome c biogenesis permease subunit
MEIKYSLQGLFIYAAMAAYLAACLSLLFRALKLSRTLYALGFVIACLSFAYRWYHVHHVPMQNLFEVFICLGALIWPISQFSRRFLAVGGVHYLASDTFLGLIVLIPAGFFFNAEPQHLPPALQSWLFAPHVAVYMLSYVFMAKAAFEASCQFAIKPQSSPPNLVVGEQAAYRMVCVGFPLLTAGLILGSIWGQFAWGDYWGWDPKELWSLASWLVYLAYFHFRYMFGRKYKRINSLWPLLGMAVILITLLWVNLSKLFPGLHSYAT